LGVPSATCVLPSNVRLESVTLGVASTRIALPLLTASVNPSKTRPAAEGLT
jgi:hypothetical protein